jgi:integrase
MEQVNALADAMPTPTLRGFVLCAAWSGLRLFEVAALEWPHITVTGDTARLHVKYGKGSKERTSILLKPGLDAVLELRPRGEQVGYVFLSSTQRPFVKQRINVEMHKAREKAGLPNAWFHDLRKFHATWLLDKGMSDMDVATQLGHFTGDGVPDAMYVRTRYGFPSTREALKRIEGIE